MSLSKLQDTINNKFLYTSNGQSENEIIKKDVNRMKRKSTNWDTIFVNYLSHNCT